MSLTSPDADQTQIPGEVQEVDDEQVEIISLEKEGKVGVANGGFDDDRPEDKIIRGNDDGEGKDKKEEEEEEEKDKEVKYPKVGVCEVVRMKCIVRAPGGIRTLLQNFQFRFSSFWDRVIIFVGILAAIICGCALPGMILLFGLLINNFVIQGHSTGNYIEKLADDLPECFGEEFVLVKNTRLSHMIQLCCATLRLY